MTLYKFCKHKPCGKRFERPEGLTNKNWEIMSYCCHEHQVQHGNFRRSEERKKNWKYCSYCKKPHHKSEFNKDNKKEDGLQSTCKKAQSVYYKRKMPTAGNLDLQHDMKRLLKWQPLLQQPWGLSE